MNSKAQSQEKIKEDTENNFDLRALTSILSDIPNRMNYIEELSDLFITIFNTFPNIDTKTMKLIKYFSEVFEYEANKSLEKISDLAYDFYSM